jgi:hypothetical protein
MGNEQKPQHGTGGDGHCRWPALSFSASGSSDFAPSKMADSSESRRVRGGCARHDLPSARLLLRTTKAAGKSMHSSLLVSGESVSIVLHFVRRKKPIWRKIDINVKSSALVLPAAQTPSAIACR